MAMRYRRSALGVELGDKGRKGVIRRLGHEDGLEKVVNQHCLAALVRFGLAVGLLKGPHEAVIVG